MRAKLGMVAYIAKNGRFAHVQKPHTKKVGPHGWCLRMQRCWHAMVIRFDETWPLRHQGSRGFVPKSSQQFVEKDAFADDKDDNAASYVS